MERHGRLFRRPDQADRVTISACHLLSGLAVRKCSAGVLRGGEALRFLDAQARLEWRMTHMVGDRPEGGVTRRGASSRPEPASTLDARQHGAIAIPAARRSSFCSRRKNCGPPIRASPRRSITAISVCRESSPRSARVAVRDRAAIGPGRANCTASAGSGTCAPPTASCRASKPRRWSTISSTVPLRARHRLAAGDRRPPHHLLAVQLGADPRLRRTALCGFLQALTAQLRYLSASYRDAPDGCRASSP